MTKEEAEKRAIALVNEWEDEINNFSKSVKYAGYSLQDKITDALMAGATLGFNHAMELNAIEDLKSRWPNDHLPEDARKVLDYCRLHLKDMWAATVVGILLNCDFRDAREALAAIEKLEVGDGQK